MSLLSKLERRLGWMAIPGLTVYIVFLQTCAYLVTWGQEQKGGTSSFREAMVFSPSHVLAGEWWRVFTFLAEPPFSNPFWTFFGLYFFYFMGTALENNWGSFRYTLYLGIAWVMTIAFAFGTWALLPADYREGVTLGNAYIGGSVFLAFAFLYPDFLIYVFFILPVKIKYMAILTWLIYGFTFITGGWMAKAGVVAAVMNFLMFFGKDIVQMLKTGKRHMHRQFERIQERDQAFHVCAACGITDKTHPKMEFRYCPLCAGSPGYCMNHINSHVHRSAVDKMG